MYKLNMNRSPKVRPKKIYDWEIGLFMAKYSYEFRIAGLGALRPKKKGRKKSLESNRKNNPKLSSDIINCTPPVDTTAEHVKQLEDELLKLRIENAYLKELRRLRLEEEALLKKQR